MNQRTISDLVGQATVRPADRPTTKQLLLTVARAFRKRDTESFKAIPDIDFKSDNVIRAIPTAGTALEPVVDLLTLLGISTEPNVLAVRQNLGLMNPQLHDLVCACRGVTVTGDQLSQRFENMAVHF